MKTPDIGSEERDPPTDLCLLVAAGDQEENAFVNPAEKK